jgi:N-acyl amino acid synthase of PEP-CTERM/exosortase system
MEIGCIGHALSKMNEDVCIEIVCTASALREAYRLRYQVYCTDRGFLSGNAGIETDGFDAHARHAIIRWRRTNEAIGTVRLVMPAGSDAEDDFPVEAVCDPSAMHGFSRSTTGEVSRFALAKHLTASVRSVSAETSSLLRLALLRGALMLSAEAGHTHWLALMQPTLLRMLRGDGLRFEPLGPIVEYHGRRQPVMANLRTMLAGAARAQPAVWHYLTAGGTLFHPQPAPCGVPGTFLPAYCPTGGLEFGIPVAA